MTGTNPTRRPQHLLAILDDWFQRIQAANDINPRFLEVMQTLIADGKIGDSVAIYHALQLVEETDANQHSDATH